MKMINKKQEARSFSLALIGISNSYREVLKRITGITQCRQRQYHIVDDSLYETPIDIVMLNVEDPNAVMQWRVLQRVHAETLKKPVIKVYSTPAKKNIKLGYSLHTPFNPSRLIKLLDQYTIKELDYIPELTIDESKNNPIPVTTVHSVSEHINNKKKAAPTKRALVVDDSDVVRHQISLKLKMKNYDATYAASGEEALALLNKEIFDIIFLDIVLPGLDGYSICKKIKKKPYLKNTPIVMLTSKSSNFDKIKGVLAGCDSYITKPVTHTEFSDVTKKYLE